MSAEWDEQVAPVGRPDVPGAYLAAQRQALGLSVEQIADQLKLALRQVVALEAGDYAALPNPAVVRGFVRAYAKVVKLDATPLVAMIPLETVPTPEASSALRRDKPAAFSEVRFPTNGKRSLPPAVAWGVGAVLVLGGALAAYELGLIPARLLHGEPASAPANGVVPPATADADKPASADSAQPRLETEAAPPAPASVPLVSTPAAAGTAQGGVAGVGAAPAEAAPATPAATAAAPAAAQAVVPAAIAGKNALVLNVREDSWLELRRVSGGAPLISRLVRGGNTETFDITEPVLLIVGKPSGVDATLRGTVVELKPVAGGTISRVNLK